MSEDNRLTSGHPNKKSPPHAIYDIKGHHYINF